MQELHDFINNFYNLSDLFYIGFKDRTTGAKISWWNKAHYKDTLDYKKLQALNYYKKDIYLTLNTFKDAQKGRFEHNIKNVKFLFFDIDYNGEIIKDKIIKELNNPTFLIQTSPEKYQLLYKLDKENYNHADVKSISKILTNYFNTDKTFDLARVFRCPFFTNNKNNFKVKILQNNKDISYSLDYFNNFIELNNLKEIEQQKDSIKTTFKASTKQKDNKAIDNTNNIDFNANNKYLSTYNNFVLKANNDKSKADLAFIRFLRYRKLNINICIKHLKECRQDLNEKHAHELDYYINCLITKAADII